VTRNSFAVGFDKGCLVIPISAASCVRVFPRVDVSPSATLTDTQPSRASRILLMCVSIMRRTRKNTSDPAAVCTVFAAITRPGPRCAICSFNAASNFQPVKDLDLV